MIAVSLEMSDEPFFFVFNSLFIIDPNGFQFSIVLVFSFFAEMSWKLTILRL